MDLLAQYADSDDSESASPELPALNDPPQPVLTTLLPPPDLSSIPTVKRPFNQTTGNGLFQGPTKLAKVSLGPKVAPKSSQLLPPQLRGRSNVVTEDMEKMFGKKLSRQKSPSAGRQVVGLADKQ